MRPRLAKALRLSAACMVAVGAIGALWAARLPMPAILLSMGSLLGVLIGTALLVLDIGARRISRWRNRDRADSTSSVPSVVMLLVVPVLWIALYYEIPFGLALAINRPAMDAWVTQATRPGAVLPQSAQVGWYEFDMIEPVSGGMRCYVRGAGFFRGAGGFAYSVAGPPTPASPAR